MVTILPSDSRVCIRFRQLVLQEVGHQSPLISGMAPKRRISARLKSIMGLGDSGGLGQFDEGLSSNSANCHKKQHGHVRAVTEPFPQYSESGNRIGDDIIENVSFCGQSSYEDIRRGVAVQYVDHGDDMYRCESCGAQFWLEESLKGASRNSPIIYTGCCKKGLVKLQDKHQQFLMNY